LEWFRLAATGEFERCDPPIPVVEFATPASNAARKAFKITKARVDALGNSILGRPKRKSSVLVDRVSIPHHPEVARGRQAAAPQKRRKI
jgi:hypothetical protein